MGSQTQKIIPAALENRLFEKRCVTDIFASEAMTRLHFVQAFVLIASSTYFQIFSMLIYSQLLKTFQGSLTFQDKAVVSQKSYRFANSQISEIVKMKSARETQIIFHHGQ